jgi:hypothetical protein
MSVATFDFSVNPAFSATVIYAGADREPILVIDDLLSDPEAIVRFAETGAAFRKEEKDFYPGIRKPLSMAYAADIGQRLQSLFRDTFGAGPDAVVEPLSALLSLATTRPQDLRPIQSVPHFDGFDGNQIAGVHYFCPEAYGGTSFYRHRSTGYESLDAHRIAEYAPRLKAEVMALGMRGFTYIQGDTLLFERTACVEAKFNRAVYYRSNILHSGDIRADVALSADPRKGRLTANTLWAPKNDNARFDERALGR